MFVDESVLSERPNRYRTWSPRGQTPVLQYHFNWKSLSAIAGVTWWRFYFRLYPGAIKSPQIIEFLKHLMRHVSDPHTGGFETRPCIGCPVPAAQAPGVGVSAALRDALHVLPHHFGGRQLDQTLRSQEEQ